MAAVKSGMSEVEQMMQQVSLHGRRVVAGLLQAGSFTILSMRSWDQAKQRALPLLESLVGRGGLRDSSAFMEEVLARC